MIKRNGEKKRKGTISIHPYSGEVMGIKKEYPEDIELDMENMLKRMFKKMDNIFIEDFGRQCPEFQWNCIQCKVWEVYERFKKDLTLTYMK